jgi:predicted RNase H-like HicB family nuclease
MGRSLHYAVLYERTDDGWVAMAPTAPAAAGQGASMEAAGEDLRQAIETALAAAEAAALVELIEDHDERGPIGEVRAGVLDIQLEDVAADAVG